MVINTSNKKILVTGCGRSGTQYTNKLFNNLGIKSTHEFVYAYKFNRRFAPFYKDTLDAVEQRWELCNAEVSWLAVPFLGTLPDNVVVFHQLRDPLKVANCWYNHELLLGTFPASCFVKFHVPEADKGSNLERVVQYILHWNWRLDEYTRNNPCKCCRYRVEDLNSVVLKGIFDRFGIYVPREDIECAFISTEVGVGGCNIHKSSISWEDIYLVKGGAELLNMAKRYGYSVPDFFVK